VSDTSKNEAAPEAGTNDAAGDNGNSNYSRFDFEEVKRRHPLADYCASRGIHLERKSGLLVGLCPLHSEDTASFTVYPDNHYYCYGCGIYGDVVDLERALGGGTASEAAERLGEVPRTYTTRQRSDERPPRQAIPDVGI
jgi:DNA primase